MKKILLIAMIFTVSIVGFSLITNVLAYWDSCGVSYFYVQEGVYAAAITEYITAVAVEGFDGFIIQMLPGLTRYDLKILENSRVLPYDMDFWYNFLAVSSILMDRFSIEKEPVAESFFTDDFRYKALMVLYTNNSVDGVIIALMFKKM